jgi:hypothetical protein
MAMKAHLQTGNILVIGLVGLLIVSCSKNDDNMKPVVTPPDTNGNPTAIGVIVDSGTVNSTTRVMKLDLSTQNFTLNGLNTEVSYATARVKVAFYVNSDGHIPTGQYAFSDSDSKAPFTFDSAALIYVPGSDAIVTKSDQVVDGTINVNRQGSIYVFSLNINLASGFNASQTYGGSLDYADSK